jgi:heat shock protein HspQ
MSTSRTKFSVGQPIHHRLFDYRGIIVDVDLEFKQSEEWYDQMARTRPPKDKPWYHVLVADDKGMRRTYVAECNLEPDSAILN